MVVAAVISAHTLPVGLFTVELLLELNINLARDLPFHPISPETAEIARLRVEKPVKLTGLLVRTCAWEPP